MITDAAPAVALLFDDTQLVEQVRDALRECGVRIVHEGGVASLTRQLLQEVGADVLVINLDDAAVDALDQVYALIDGDRPRIVFNDAHASAALAGWDRARWARHLAVKVCQAGGVDPPRPADAVGVEVPAGVWDGLPPTMEEGEVAAPGAAQTPVAGTASGLVDAADADEAAEAARRSQRETEALSAELEALLASEEQQAIEAGEVSADVAAPAPAELVPGLDQSIPGFDAPGSDADADEPKEAPAMGLDDLLRGQPFGPEAPTGDVAAPAAPVLELVDLRADASAGAPAASPAKGLDDFLRDLPAGLEMLADNAAAPARSAPAPEVALPEIPAEWALLDDDAITPATFGVEKLSAADYLAPDVEMVAPGEEPVMNLELVSMEEAVAPRPIHADVEMHLDELHMALSRLVLTGCTLGGASAALAFFAAVPATTRQTFLHTQHLRGQSVDELLAQLASVCPLAVRLATADSTTQPGEILVVPPGNGVRVYRDGRVELLPNADETGEPCIDASFKMAAEGFGRDALAIVFSGHHTDSIAGAKAVHEAGGQVWVETAAAEYADMVNEIAAAGIVDFSAAPEALAAHLVEVLA